MSRASSDIPSLGNPGQDEDVQTDMDQEQDGQRSPKRSKRSGLRHISQACDICKSKKRRCDGRQPCCTSCSERGTTCSYKRQDGRSRRKGNQTDLRDRIDSLMQLLSTQNALLQDGKPGSLVPSLTESPTATITTQTPPEAMNILANAVTGIEQLNTPPQPSFVPSLPPPQVHDSAPELVDTAASASPEAMVSFATRLKRPERGSLMQFGPTSLWSYAQDAKEKPPAPSPQHVDLLPGDWIDWARPIPSELNISKATHDSAIAFFASYYAPWCMVVDMSAFLRDLEICNVVTRLPRSTPSPTRTAAYSPLLHNCVLYLGLHLQREIWPDIAQAMDGLIDKHCPTLIMREIEDPNTSTLLALTLFATCLNIRKDVSARNSGYIYFGMAFAAVQALGVNIKCDHLVPSGQISVEERDVRNNTYWTIFQQDLLRAIGAGRPPMLGSSTDIPFPSIDPLRDALPWYSSNPLKVCSSNGQPGMISTVFHWSARLHCILRRVLETSLYSVNGDIQTRDSRVVAIAQELEMWKQSQPFLNPSLQPLPHLLVTHMLYHLTCIYLFRPYYRSQLEISPSPAERCNEAAKSIGRLLSLYETEHGLRNGSATLIPIVFGTATIYLLVLVSSDLAPSDNQANVNRLDQATWFMSQLALTWTEARRGLEVINTLRSEWLPHLTDPVISNLSIPNLSIPTLDESEELPKELHEWLMGTSFWELLRGNDDSIPNLELTQ